MGYHAHVTNTTATNTTADGGRWWRCWHMLVVESPAETDQNRLRHMAWLVVVRLVTCMRGGGSPRLGPGLQLVAGSSADSHDAGLRCGPAMVTRQCLMVTWQTLPGRWHRHRHSRTPLTHPPSLSLSHPLAHPTLSRTLSQTPASHTPSLAPTLAHPTLSHPLAHRPASGGTWARRTALGRRSRSGLWKGEGSEISLAQGQAI